MNLVGYTATALSRNDIEDTPTNKNVVDFAIVELKDLNGDLVVIYDDETGLNPETQKTCDTNGQVTFFAEIGNYDLEINGKAQRINLSSGLASFISTSDGSSVQERFNGLGYQFDTVDDAKNYSDIESLSGSRVYLKDRQAYFNVVPSLSILPNDYDEILSNSNSSFGFKLEVTGKVSLRSLGVDLTGTTGSSGAVNRAHELGVNVYDDTGGTILLESTVRFQQSFEGCNSIVGDGPVTDFKKSTGVLIVHYSQFKSYKNYSIDANGEQTAFDIHRPSGGSVFDGGLKYCIVENIRTRGQTLRAFNLNGPLFGSTLTNCRVRANQEAEDETTSFYCVIEDSEGVGTPTGSTNASFNLISPNVYNATGRANNVTFIHLEYARGVSVTGAEVACARIGKFLQADINIQGAFEYINTHSTVFRSTIGIGDGTNIQTFRLGTEDWTGDTDIPASNSHGRHIFRIDDDTAFNVGSVSFFNQMGRTSGSSGVVGFCGVASGFSGRASATKVIEYNDGGGGFSQTFQYKDNSGELSALCCTGDTTYRNTFSKTLDSTDGQSFLDAQGHVNFRITSTGDVTTLTPESNQDYRVSSDTEIKECTVSLAGESTLNDIGVRVRTFDSAGGVVGTAATVLTIPSGSDTSYYGVGEDPNRVIPAGGYCKVDVLPSGGVIGSNTTIYVNLSFNA